MQTFVVTCDAYFWPEEFLKTQIVTKKYDGSLQNILPHNIEQCFYMYRQISYATHIFGHLKLTNRCNNGKVHSRAGAHHLIPGKAL